jgi:hypothetical protein
MDGGWLRVEGSRFTDNLAARQGGAVYMQRPAETPDSALQLDLLACSFFGNRGVAKVCASFSILNGFRLPAAPVESSRASPPHSPREDGLDHPADTSISNLAAALALLSRWRLSKP